MFPSSHSFCVRASWLSLSLLIGLRFSADWRAREHPTWILCPNFSQPCNYVILCSGFPWRPLSALADRSMKKRWLNVSFFEQPVSPVIWLLWYHLGSASLQVWTKQIRNPSQGVSHLYNFLARALWWRNLNSLEKVSQTNRDADLIDRQEMLSNVGREVKAHFFFELARTSKVNSELMWIDVFSSALFFVSH